ncbi:p027 [Rhizobium phage 16-3]|uniref:p027 n=1 Tax=Rhizobium phage 16-3 TaxID=10704 RepID=UPI00017BA5BF|nr:p027 [Rhizobium phage 16-3]ABF71279.1 p027 [Rhizobium phage 16-3]
MFLKNRQKRGVTRPESFAVNDIFQGIIDPVVRMPPILLGLIRTQFIRQSGLPLTMPTVD